MRTVKRIGVIAALAVIAFLVGQGPVGAVVNTYIDDVRLTSAADLVVYDDLYVKFGTDGDFGVRFNATSTRWEIVDAGGNVMLQIVDGGTTGTGTVTGDLTVGLDLTVSGNDIVTAGVANIKPGGTTRLAISSTATTFSNDALPSANNARDLGATATRWKDLYLSGDGYIDGGDLSSTAATMNVFNTTSTTVNAFGAATTVAIGATTGTTTVGNNLKADSVIATTLTTMTANDTTPSVAGTNTLIVPGTWTAANNITALDDGVAGQRVTVLGGDSDCVVNDASTLKLTGAWTAAAGATLSLVFDGTNWNEIGRTAN